ncbi:MAG: ABC-F family ATP-binding cassette domain-containing protein, partial [Nitrospirae bacterium]|nr:ABC-F family ATP-binding cassette domain-containing protein [Nitrospirota bacterium]
MLQVSDLSKAYGQQLLLERASFNVNPSERIGLVGRNGHGKTTLFRLILGEEKPDDGTISVPAGYTVGHLSQHIRFTCPTVLEEGCLGLHESEDGRDESYKVKSILSGLGFSPDDFGRDPHSLSGGYQIRLNLAKLLAESPHLLLLDEPTNYLDIISIRWLTQFLRNWKDELILITHDRDFMDSVTTHTMGIHRCKIRKIAGPTGKLYEQLLQEEEVYEQTRLNEDKKRKEVEQFINRFRAQATRASAVQSKIKALRKKDALQKLAEEKNLDFEFISAPFTGKFLIESENISFAFTPEDPIINSFSLAVAKNDRIAVIGKNGKGKSTLLNLLSGELLPSTGNITRHPKLKPAHFGQTNISRLDPQKTVEDEILDVLPEYNRKHARTICGTMMFEKDNALKKVEVLSGGEKSRVLLGKLLASPANLLLLDEPTNHLDMESIDSLMEALSAFEGAVIIVTHSEMILHALASRLVVFDAGQVRVFEGTYQDFLDRVGWSNEAGEENAGVTEESGQRNGLSRKDIRRQRAAIIGERSRVLGALNTKITEKEATIMELERKVNDETGVLLDASLKGDGAA